MRPVQLIWIEYEATLSKKYLLTTSKGTTRLRNHRLLFETVAGGSGDVVLEALDDEAPGGGGGRTPDEDFAPAETVPFLRAAALAAFAAAPSQTGSDRVVPAFSPTKARSRMAAALPSPFFGRDDLARSRAI